MVIGRPIQRPFKIDDELLVQLRTAIGSALISIYLPTHRHGDSVRQDRVRLSNGITQSDRMLEAVDWKPRDRKSILARASELLGNEEFWQHQDSGLAVFVHPDTALLPVALPGGAPERTTVSTVFHIRPMLPSIELDFPVLVLAKGGATLYRSSMHRISPIEGELPGSIDEVNWFVDREKQRQQHPNRAGLTKSGHGHEGGSRPEDLARYLRAVAQSVAKLTEDEQLIVLGDDNLTDRFIQITSQDATTPSSSGVANPSDSLEVHKRATPTIAEFGLASTNRLVENAKRHLGTDNAITDLQSALNAASSGRLSHLLIHDNASPVWGRCHPNLAVAALHDQQLPFSDDLLDRLAVAAIDTGACVISTDEPIEGYVFVGIPRF